MIAVVHTGGYAVIQVEHRRDKNSQVSVNCWVASMAKQSENGWHLFVFFFIFGVKKMEKVRNWSFLILPC